MVRRLLGALAGLAVVTGVLTPAPPAGAVNDPYRPRQWGLDVIRADQAWSTGTGSGATIAVVDSGVDLTHEDLASKVVASVSCIGANGDPDRCRGSAQDDDGHGTHVAGIAAAATGNAKGVAGTAPAAGIMAIRVLEHQPPNDPSQDGPGQATGSAQDVAAGIRWAVNHGATVINLSLGSTISLFDLLGNSVTDAINAAWDAGALVVVAAGNTQLFPSGYQNVKAIVVTATTRDDRKASYASDIATAAWGMAAPGGDVVGDPPDPAQMIFSTLWWKDGTRYGAMAGTSMAAPFVAGAGAVLRSLGLSRDQARDRLLATAADLGTPGRDGVYGYGRLDLAAAVAGYGSQAGRSAGPSSPAPPAPSTAPARVQGSAAAPPPPSSGSTVAPPGSTAPPPTGPGAPAGPILAAPAPGPPQLAGPSPTLQAALAPRSRTHGGGGSAVPYVAGGGLVAAGGAFWLLRRRFSA